MIRVLIVDDEALIRQGMASLLSLQDDFQVVGQASNGAEALKLATELKPDVVLMDIQMPVCDGVEATKAIRDTLPEVKILVLTTYDDDKYVYEAIAGGASGYLLKDAGSDQVASALRSVHGGFSPLSPSVSEKIMSALKSSADSGAGGNTGARSDAQGVSASATAPQLTPREIEVLKLIQLGLSNKEIAQRLNIAERTVREHITHILTQLNLRDRTQAALWAQQNL